MQTITKTKSIIDEARGLLHRPVESIDLNFFANSIRFLRSTVDKEAEAAVSHLGKSAIDLAGTGGSGTAKFNTSTTTAFVLASHGVNVIKFGNRSITGNSGSVDFLSALGLERDLPATQLEAFLSKTNLLFLNAHKCYPALAPLREERRTLGRPTVFNFAGPLLNPARPAFRLLGVSNKHMLNVVNAFLPHDETLERAITVRSASGLDELSTGEENEVLLIDRKTTLRQVFDVERTDCVPTKLSHTPEENARLFHNIIDGNDSSSIHYSSVVLNSGAAFLATKAVGSIEEGTKLAKGLLTNGSVQRKFQQIREKLA